MNVAPTTMLRSNSAKDASSFQGFVVLSPDVSACSFMRWASRSSAALKFFATAPTKLAATQVTPIPIEAVANSLPDRVFAQ